MLNPVSQKCLRTVLVLVFSTIFTSLSFAASEVDLYSERVVVSQNASQQEQDKAIATSFSRLLVRVTGVQDVLINDVIVGELDDGKRYLASFRYEASDEFFTNVLGEAVPTKTMVLDFDKKSVDALLVRNGLPVWGSKRPDVLIWIANRSSSGDRMISDSDSSEISSLLKSNAAARGIPYLLPIMDLNDTLALSFADLYGLFSADIESASERYQPEAVLAGRINEVGSAYQADWMLLFKNERLRLPTVTGSLDHVIAKAIDMVSARLSEQYALLLDPSMIGTYQIKVTNIDSLAQFTALENYLKSINVITRVTVAHFQQTEVVFNLQLSGDSAQLADILALDDHLEPVYEDSLVEQLDNITVYNWAD